MNTNINPSMLFATVNDVRSAYFGTQFWLKAPNGKPSLLSESQWLQVRTAAFKQWFGDWEFKPSQASQVIDENGEPLVCYHGTPSNHYDFSVFNSYDEGIFFAEHKYVADRYADRRSESGLVKAVFLNIRTPKAINTVAYTFNGFRGADARLKKMADRNIKAHPEYKNTPYRYKEFVREKLQAKKYDGMVLENHSWEHRIDCSRQFVAFAPSQIKSATANNGLYSAVDDIYL